MANVVLGVAFFLESLSSRQALRQDQGDARKHGRDGFEQVLNSSDTTTRAVFAEDGADLTGILLAFAGILARQLTGAPVPDALGSIKVGTAVGVYRRSADPGKQALPGGPSCHRRS